MTRDRTETTPLTAAELAAGYFDAWRRRDIDAFDALLADDVTFRGPMGETDGRDATRSGFQGLSSITKDVVIEHVFVDGDDVATWFELRTTVTERPLNVVNWMHASNGSIDRIRVTFDPRPLLEARPA